MWNSAAPLIKFLEFAGAADADLNVHVWLKSEGPDGEPKRPLILRKLGPDRTRPTITTLRRTKFTLIGVYRKNGDFRIETIAERPWRAEKRRGVHSLLSLMHAVGL